MALPQLNMTPKYEMVIPSTNAAVRFRPFLVKEEKILMLAAESEDPKQIVAAIGDMVEGCIVGDIKRENLTAVDIEYAFLQIRAKSVGETTTIGLKCAKCNAENSVQINLSKIDPPVGKKLTAKIELDKNIFIELKQPTFDSVVSSIQNDDSISQTDQILAIVAQCISAIITENENIKASSVTQEELIEFLSSMNGTQFAKIREFVDQLPRLRHVVDFKCESCGHKNNVTIEGIQSFLV
tara:strand:- start:2339 stop:3055 length:717 start_codon:yes stop_codon:yes gene_type:complete